MYGVDKRAEALALLDSGLGLREAAARAGVSHTALGRWAADRRSALAERRPARKPPVYLRVEEKLGLLGRLARGEAAGELAAEAGVAEGTLLAWRRREMREGAAALRTRADAHGTPPARRPRGGAPTYEELELEVAILREEIELLKKGPGAGPPALTNREKAAVAAALRGRFGLRRVLEALGLARSTYYYQASAAAAGDKHAALRERIRRVFEASGRAWGSQRVWAELRAPHDGGAPLRVSEKVVRRLMREEGLEVEYGRGRLRPYSSYAGEPDEAPPNLTLGGDGSHGFSALFPNELWVSDITEFRIPAGKVYLSPVLDCFDGALAGWSIGPRPTAELANSSLERACAGLGAGEAPVVHTDRGGHYRWEGWKGACAARGLTRSMSRKATSPDNARMEGFFGTLKNEFFHHRDWEGVSLAEFCELLDRWLRYYNERRPKASLGWMSPKEFRESRGFALRV